MGACLCPQNKSDDSYYLVKEEKKRYLPAFPDEDAILTSPKNLSPKKKQNDLLIDEKKKETPASLLYVNENSPMLMEEKNHTPSFESFNIKKVIGKGSYGRVLLVEKKGTGFVYLLL